MIRLLVYLFTIPLFAQWIEVRPRLIEPAPRRWPLAYLPKALEIQPGSLNLLPPGDKIPEHDALQMLNWRADVAGQLVSRKGSMQIVRYQGYGVPSVVPIRVIRKSDAPFQQYYVQASDRLFRGGAITYTEFNRSTSLVSMVPYAGYMWIMSQNLAIKDDGTTYSLPWSPPTPGSAPTNSTAAGGALTGDYSYYVTYVTDKSEESNPSPVLKLTGLSSNKVTITRPVVSSTQVTKWNLYRIGGGLQDAMRVNATPIAYATSTYDDYGDAAHTQSDDDLERLGIILETDHDPVGVCDGIAGPYMERIIFWKGNKLMWTPPNRPSFVRGFSSDSEGDWVLVGEDTEPIVNVTLRDNEIRIYKNNSIWILEGDPDNGRLRLKVAGMGLIGQMAICSFGPFDAFQSKEGVQVFNGDTYRPITGQLAPLFKDEWVNIGPISYPPLDVNNRQYNAMGHRNGRIYFSYADSTDALLMAPNKTVVYDIDSGRWVQDDRSISAYFDEGQSGDLLSGRVNFLYALERGTSDNGVGFTVAYQSRYYDFGLPENAKTFADLVIEGETGGAILTVKAHYDNGTRPEEVLGTFNAAANTAKVFKFSNGQGTQAKNAAIRIEGDLRDTQTAKIKRIILHYYIEARDAKSFDTDESDLGFPGKVKRVDAIELDIQATGSYVVKVSTELPEGAMAERFSALLPATTTRQPVLIPITELSATRVEGKLVRITITTDSSFRLYGARARVLPIGTYINGAAGETWRTQELSYAQ